MHVSYVDLPIGTRRTVRVLGCYTAYGRTVLVCCDHPEPPAGQREGYVCLYRAGAVSADVGQLGTLTIAEGGPMGRYWRWEPASEG